MPELGDVAAALIGAGALVDIQEQVGKPTKVILDRVDEHRPDLVVLGTRGLTGIERLRVGSTAGAVARIGSVLRPPGLRRRLTVQPLAQTLSLMPSHSWSNDQRPLSRWMLADVIGVDEVVRTPPASPGSRRRRRSDPSCRVPGRRRPPMIFGESPRHVQRAAAAEVEDDHPGMIGRRRHFEGDLGLEDVGVELDEAIEVGCQRGDVVEPVDSCIRA